MAETLAIMSKAMIQQRLLTTVPKKGRRTPGETLRLYDIADHTGVSLATLSACAHRRREVDDALQAQLSYFFALFERGVLVKQREGRGFVIRRVRPPDATPEPERPRIDISGFEPRINWR